MREVTPAELFELLATPGLIQVIDVRDAHEAEARTIKGATNIPAHAVMGRLGELDRTRRIVVVSRSGHRSWKVSGQLESEGFDVWNLSGGLRAWVREIDPTLPI